MSDVPPPPPPPPPPPQPGPQEPFGAAPLESVGAWPRFGARVIDALVLLVPNLIIVAVVGDGGNAFGGVSGVDNLLAGVLTTFLGFGYAVYLESATGATVGKRVLGYKVVGLDGRNPSSEMAARRNAWLLLGLIPILGGLLSLGLVIAIAVTISRDPFNRGLHDNFAGGSAVVRAR